MEFDFFYKSTFDFKIVKNIFIDIEEAIKENVLAMHSSIIEDNKKYFERFEFSKLLNVIDMMKNEEWILTKNTTKLIYKGVGNIGVCYRGSPEIFLYLALKALKTNNNIVFFENEETHQTTKLLQSYIDAACKKNNYNAYIKTVKYNEVLDFVNEANKFNKFIFINEQQKYLDFCAREQSGVETMCSNYGTMDVFLDDNQLQERLNEMDEYVHKNNIELEIHRNKEVQNVVKKINIRKHNYCAVIFTTNMQDAYYFLENVQADKIFINKNPGNEYNLYIGDEEFTTSKQIYI